MKVLLVTAFALAVVSIANGQSTCDRCEQCSRITNIPNNQCNVSSAQCDIDKWLNDPEISTFRKYLQISTIQPNVNYTPAIEFIIGEVERAGLPYEIYYPVNQQNPVLVAKWEGSQPQLPSIMCNSHMDTVPVFLDSWFYDPLSACIDCCGNIFARGSQDMKVLGMQYLAAVRALKAQGVQQLLRTIYITFMPDEEQGGFQGMAGFVNSSEFQSMNVGVELDEGGGVNLPPNQQQVNFREKSSWKVQFNINGPTAHGALFVPNSASDKMTILLDKMAAQKAQVEQALASGVPLSNVTTINPTLLDGGIAINIIPQQINMTVDIRLSINENFTAFEQMLDEWVADAGGNIDMIFLQKDPQSVASPTDTNPFWKPYIDALEVSGIVPSEIVLFAFTDARYLRFAGVPSWGTTADVNTTFLIHGDNEYLNGDIYNFGIKTYTNVFKALGNFQLGPKPGSE